MRILSVEAGRIAGEYHSGSRRLIYYSLALPHLVNFGQFCQLELFNGLPT
jgi:hypothetical protein